MNRILSLKIVQLCVCLLWVSMLFSCGSSRKSTISSNKTFLSEWKDPLSAEDRRKFNHFFLEAVRLKEKGEMDAAFEMYSHCLAIDSQSAATLYELGKFYMYLGQPTKGENFLRKAMLTQPGNYWYKETLAGYYQGKGEDAKAIDVIESMVDQFPSRLEPLMALVDLYNRTRDYQKVIHTLDRLERLDGKSEQVSMEKFRMYLAMDNNEKALSDHAWGCVYGKW